MNRVNIITLGVRDISASLAFYRNLGFEASIVGEEEAPDIVFFKTDGSKLALFPMDRLAAETGSEAAFQNTGFNGITLAYNAKSEAEVDHVLNDVIELGGEVTSTAAPTGWGGYGGYFTDPDGYHWEVAYGTDWEFDENDMLII
ncbi:VOC family protein [Salinicoccus sp. HZC-1]|uniref:VOC family protein n=1 Tax=Salinicoccus sp. HZC-1 TaxID=3385497 RepID=UPI00398AD8F6